MAEGFRFDLESAGLDLEAADEVVRVFIEDGNILLINAERLGEPFILGMLCVDLMKHGAFAFAQAKDMEPQEAFEAIMAGLTAELQNPTDGEGDSH